LCLGSPCLWEELTRIGTAYRAGRQLLLLFDYDGTLAPLVTHPALAHCLPSMRHLLAQFAELPRLRVGIVSGRGIDDLKAMVRVPSLIYAGTSGLELESNGSLLVHPRAGRYRPFLDHAAIALQTLAARFAGAWVENKPLGLTVHYRNVNRGESPLLRQCVTSVLVRYEGLLIAADSFLAVEILPAVGWAKGETLRHILDSHGDSTLLLYAGNDANDTEALQIAATMGGVAVGIGPTAPETAQHHLPDVERLAEEMHALYAMIRI
jgi:trehalose 6-phosphate phosphatase